MDFQARPRFGLVFLVSGLKYRTHLLLGLMGKF